MMSKPRGRPFQPGNHYGRGRPKGSRNKTTLVAQQLLDQHSESLVRKCIIEALNGNIHALKLCIERLTPVRRDNLIRLRLPAFASAKDLALVVQSIFAAVQRGQITPLEGESLANILEKHRRGIETVELSERVDQLEHYEQERGRRGQT